MISYGNDNFSWKMQQHNIDTLVIRRLFFFCKTFIKLFGDIGKLGSYFLLIYSQLNYITNEYLNINSIVIFYCLLWIFFNVELIL